MAKKKKNERIDYPSVVRALKKDGPQRLYLLWGEEEYLREKYLEELKALCLPEGEDGFSFKRFNGPELDPRALQQAVDAVPFLSERSFVELRDVDLAHLSDPDGVARVLSDIPDYCTIAFVQNASFEPDNRLKLFKLFQTQGVDLRFDSQNQDELTKWIARRFAALNKGIEMEASQRLIFISGDLMNRLIPEIEKVAAFAKGEKVTVADVEAVATHIPEAVIYDMTDLIAQKKINNAFAVLAELLSDRNNEPIPMLAMLGIQMRRLYAAKLAAEQGLGVPYVMETCGVKYESHANTLLRTARGFTLPQLKRAVEICAETDYRMKSSGLDAKELFKEAVLRIAAGEIDAQR